MPATAKVAFPVMVTLTNKTLKCSNSTTLNTKWKGYPCHINWWNKESVNLEDAFEMFFTGKTYRSTSERS